MAAVLAVAAALWMALYPCTYVGIAATGTDDLETGTRTCRSFIEVNGIGGVLVLLVPVALAGLGLAAARRGRRAPFIVATVWLVGFCALSLASVGLWFVPSAIATLIAVVSAWETPEAVRP